MKGVIPLVCLLLQIPGVILLYLGSIEMPWSKRTWKGETKEEKTYRKKQLIMGITGLILVLIGCGLILILYLREILQAAQGV